MQSYKTFKKILLSLLFFSLLITIAYPATVEARGLFDSTKNPLIFKPQIGVPGVYEQGTEYVLTENNTSYIAKMVKGFYNYGIGIAGILAAIMLMAGGLVWLTSAGSSEKITQAKNLMGGSVIGLVILFGSWMLLRTINPALVDFNIRTITGISNITLEDGADGYIDSAGNLPPDTEIEVKCLATNLEQICLDTNPPSMELDVSICINLEPEKWQNTECLAPNTRHCCATSQTMQAEIDKECKGERNGTPCKATATDFETIGVCKNEKCEGGNVCCQCGHACALGVCVTNQCRNDLNPKECREWCIDPILGWSVWYNVGGSDKYDCAEGSGSQCTLK